MAYDPFAAVRSIAPLAPIPRVRVGAEGGSLRDPGDPTAIQPAPSPVAFPDLPEISPFDRVLSIAGAGIGAYHGYKRNDSVGWAIGWGVLGAMFPVITSAVAFAQGVGKRA